MVKELDLEEFYTHGNDIGAISMIMPDRVINVYNLNDGKSLHETTEIYVLNEIFDLNIDMNKSRIKVLSQLNEKLPGTYHNFIFVRHLSYKERMAFIEIPAYITNYEYRELIKLNNQLKDLKVPVNVYITSYDPIILDHDKSKNEMIFHKNIYALDEALETIVNNNKICEYELDFKKKRNKVLRRVL